jgi:hypothetical protein
MHWNIVRSILDRILLKDNILKTYKQAIEVIEKNQEAIVLFTHGEHFLYDLVGNGQSGKWVLDPENAENVDKVIIYLRRNDEPMNRIFLGNYAGIRKSDLPGRYVVRFSALKEVGTTESSWLDFAKGGQNPVSYITA